jgi:fermentation-respiration switch protein FrsA (DUF1100 family)
VRAVFLVALATLLAGAALWLAQRKLIYLPGGAPGPPPMGWQAISLTTADELTLGAWFAPPQADAAIVIVFNGNAGNRADRIGLGSRLAGEGAGVVLLDYRGYGGNPGSPSEEGLAMDASAAAEWVAAQFSDHRVVYFGESLGAAVAIRLAGERPPHALVLRSPFTSLPDAAAVHYPYLPVARLIWDAYPSIDRIGALAVPVTVIAGSDDSIVPVDQSRAIFDAAPEPKSWLLIEGADHNDPELTGGEQIVEAILDVVG